MDKQTIITKLKAHAEYLRKTRVPVGEAEVVDRLVACAASLDNLANELAAEETKE